MSRNKMEVEILDCLRQSILQQYETELQRVEDIHVANMAILKEVQKLVSGELDDATAKQAMILISSLKKY